MKTVEVSFEGGGEFRPSEIVADLRTAAETLYFPMRICGFWDRTNDLHLCPTATPSATATSAPAWWESPTPSPTPDIPESRVWNMRVEALSDSEVTVTFDYHLDLAPEANVFVHMGLLPNINLILLDAAGETIEGTAGELDPTEFGDDTVGGQATFIFATTRFDEVAAVDVCIRVVTGNYDDFTGRTEIFCEPVPAERVAAE